MGDGRHWAQVGKRPLVGGVDISGGQEKWEQGPTSQRVTTGVRVVNLPSQFKLSLQAHVIVFVEYSFNFNFPLGTQPFFRNPPP